MQVKKRGGAEAGRWGGGGVAGGECENGAGAVRGAGGCGAAAAQRAGNEGRRQDGE